MHLWARSDLRVDVGCNRSAALEFYILATLWFWARDCISSTPILSHQLCLRQHMAPHGAFQFVPVRAGRHVEFGVERIKLKEIAVGLARRRTGPAIADALEIVLALAGAILEI